MTKKAKSIKAFDGQRDGEELLFVFRRHIIAMRKGFYLLLVPMTIGALPYLIWQDNLNLLWVFLGSFVFGLVLFDVVLYVLHCDKSATSPDNAAWFFW